jgi:PAS domain S-box-containing protein
MASGDAEHEELLRLRAENEKLRAAAATGMDQYRLLFNRAPYAMSIFSFEKAAFLQANDAYLEIVGCTREEFFERDPYELWLSTTHPEDLELERKELQRMAEGRIDGYRMKKRYRCGGEWRWMAFATEALRDERGRLSVCSMHVLDVHDEHTAVRAREVLEDRLRQAQKLESMGRLVGGVAHDFNNRLLVIMGYAEMLKRAAAQNPEIESHADVVLTSARRAADLTRQLLAFGRRQVLKPRSTDLNTLVDSMRRMFERVIGEGIELVTVLGAKHPMLADPGQIEQVLMNLVLNARDAVLESGRITIETADAEVSAGELSDTLPGSYVTLAVADTGPGVPEAIRDQIFEPFFTTKDVGKGTGLGLAMVDGIVRQSGGIVTLESAEGRGATFTAYLPRAAEKRRTETPQPFPAAAELTNVETVLVVDDEEAVRKFLIDVLAIGAYHVLEARDGHHALEVSAAHTGSIDLLVTDVVMPRMKGPELAERLRERHPALRTLYVSGYAERDTLPALGENEHFLAKPFSATDLFRIARDILVSDGDASVDRVG